MIYVDVTKTAAAGHRSGLTRVTSRLLAELGGEATPLAWPFAKGARRHQDWLLTAELFSEFERPGITEFLDARHCRAAAIFHDAIPLKHPHTTWPQSVARHPGYMKLLARFDRVWAVSAASRDELLGFWRWQGLGTTPSVDVLPLGADFNAAPRRAAGTPPHGAVGPPLLFCLGIIEPRKNQGFLLEVCGDLWDGGLDFELHLSGRVNPHFGRPLVRQIQATARRYRGLRFHRAAGDAQVSRLFAAARATVLPTIAEGCGLPLLESLWCGVPCVCSDLPVLLENAAGGGVLAVPPNDRSAWRAALQRIVTDDGLHVELARQAATRPLATWHDAAQVLLRALR
jgi:glycosyltransferase involved in cell wall biosynthesis